MRINKRLIAKQRTRMAFNIPTINMTWVRDVISNFGAAIAKAFKAVVDAMRQVGEAIIRYFDEHPEVRVGLELNTANNRGERYLITNKQHTEANLIEEDIKKYQGVMY